TNENTNGLIRQFLPKSATLDKVTDDEIKAIEDNLNNRPRKVLGYQTPLEVKSRFGCVALQT
ncbi:MULTISPECIES: IS30 family transposase, partial [Pasteurellaceae]|nr:IS30 family transposase [Pasteurella atlantica]MDP8038975.1 IS30 family transposase [Pasteurella atlantica]MDP8040916.1 IS30 family transposase [Pasteurella atlantica]MDP8043052.1 IS30 family transposase [Pasteurella atlantica]MDP8045138.1 IS30 family transposase [Pasteurella atlantica]